MSGKKEEKIDKSFVGKYVCYVKADGSFTWGLVKDQGFINTATKGEREVFVLTDQLTCRVAASQLELATIKRIDHLLAEGKGGPSLLPGPTDPLSLPAYQQFGDRKKLKAACIEVIETGMVKVEKQDALVPTENKDIGFRKTPGLRMFQKVGMVLSSQDGHEINFIVRKFGYDTIVHKDSLNLQGDVVDPDSEDHRFMSEGELFMKVMSAKLKGGHMLGVIGHKALGSGGRD
jgi:hypothetical protein